MLINSDTIVTPGWLRKLYAVMAGDASIAGVGPLSNAASWQSIPRTKAPTGEWVVNAFGPSATPDRIAAELEQMDDGAAPDFPLLNGFCTLFRKAALEQVGYFDDDAFPRGYGEENDLCVRLTKAGWSLRVAPDTYVHHAKSRSFGISQRTELSKAANQVLRGKHPEIDFPVLEETMRNDPTINRIRGAIAGRFGVEPRPDLTPSP